MFEYARDDIAQAGSRIVASGRWMKVLQIHDKHLDPIEETAEATLEDVRPAEGGGLTVYVAQLITGLRSRDWQVSVVGFEPNPESETAAPGWYRLRSFRHHFRSDVLAQLLRIVEAEDPDVIHLQSMPSIHPVLVRRLADMKPIVWTFHDVTPFCFWRTKLHRNGSICTRRLGWSCMTSGCYRIGGVEPPLRDALRVLSHPIYRRMYRRMPVLIVPSHYIRDVFVDNGLDETHVQVVPLFSRFEGVSGSPAPELATPRILFVGHLTKEKGIPELLEALGLLRDASWEARIVGDGPLRDDAPRLAATHGIEERITFVGGIAGRALEEQYRWCSLLVMPSIGPESFGLVGVEAMSFGKPVVAFESGGVTEWLEDGINGFLARHRDPPHLAAQIGRLVRDECLRAQQGAAGREKLVTELSHTQHLDHVLALYDRVIQERSRASA